MAIFTVAACSDVVSSGKSENENAEPRQQAEAKPAGIAIAAISGLPAAEANVFSALLRKEAVRTKLPLAAGQGATAYEISGAMSAGENAGKTYLVTVIDVQDRAGKRVHRLVSETVLPSATNGDPWAGIDKNDLQGVASDTAVKLASWYETTVEARGGILAKANESGIETGSITAAAQIFDIDVGPTPGDGNIALTRALGNALSRRAPDATWLRNERYRVEGSVVTASRNDGDTDVSIHWVVKSAAGEPVGEVTQRNALDPSRIAGTWGPVAEAAAESAADGVIALLAPPAGKS